MKADYTSDEDEEEDEGSDIEKSRAKRLEKAKTALRDSDEESEKSKRSSRLFLITSFLCNQKLTCGASSSIITKIRDVVIRNGTIVN